MASDEFREIVGLMTNKGNIYGIKASYILQSYCEKNNIKTDDFNYSHLQDFQFYAKYQELKSDCGDIRFESINKGIEKLIEENVDEIEKQKMQKIKKELFDI